MRCKRQQQFKHLIDTVHLPSVTAVRAPIRLDLLSPGRKTLAYKFNVAELLKHTVKR